MLDSIRSQSRQSHRIEIDGIRVLTSRTAFASYRSLPDLAPNRRDKLV